MLLWYLAGTRERFNPPCGIAGLNKGAGLSKGWWLCSNLSCQSSTKAPVGISQPLGYSVPIQVPGAREHPPATASGRFGLARAAAWGFFFFFRSVCCRKLPFYLTRGLSARADAGSLLPFVPRGALDLPCCCRAAAVPGSLLFFSFPSSFLAQRGSAFIYFCDVCSSCCSHFPYVDACLSRVGKNSHDPVS